MKIINYIFLIVIFCLSSCNFSKKETKANSEEVENFINKNLDPNPGKPFFEFDAIDYYNVEIDEYTASNLLNTRKTAFDNIKYNLILDEASENISDNYFLNNLAKVGYKKSEIDPNDFQHLTSLFSERSERDGLYFECFPTFRDILVFKKDKKVIGVAKLDLGCNKYKIIGTDANTKNFGQGKDYEILSLIFNKYIDKNYNTSIR